MIGAAVCTSGHEHLNSLSKRICDLEEALNDLEAMVEFAAVTCCVDVTEFQRGRADGLIAVKKALEDIRKRRGVE